MGQPGDATSGSTQPQTQLNLRQTSRWYDGGLLDLLPFTASQSTRLSRPEPTPISAPPTSPPHSQSHGELNTEPETRDNQSRREPTQSENPALQVDVVVVHYNAHEALSECLAPLCSALRQVEGQVEGQTEGQSEGQTEGQSSPHAAHSHREPTKPTTTASFSLTVIDNDNRNPALQADQDLKETPRAHYVASTTNTGFGAASNTGARLGSAPFILFLNPDCIVDEAAISDLATVLQNDPAAVAVGPRIQRPDGFPEISWARHPGFIWEIGRRRLWRALSARKPWAVEQAQALLAKPRDVDWLTAACLLVRRDAFEAIGGFDEAFFLYFEDADLGSRLGGHGSLRFEPSIVATHYGGASAEKEASGTLHHYRASQRRYYQKHRPPWERISLRLWRLIKP